MFYHLLFKPEFIPRARQAAVVSKTRFYIPVSYTHLFAVAMTKASKTVSACFRKAGSQAWMVPVPENPETHLPAWDKLKAVYAKIYEMMGKNQILSASVVREGGAAAAVCRMCFGNQMGFQFAGDPDQKTLFAPLSGSLVLELKDDSDTTGLETLGASVLGTVCGEPVILIGSERLSLAALTEAWEKPLEKVFPTRAETKAYFCQVPLYSERNQKAPAVQSVSYTHLDVYKRQAMDGIYSFLNLLLPFEWAEFDFMKNALLAVLMITPLFGLTGTMIVNNKMSFFSDALGHSALTGIAIGVMMGIDNYLISMLGFALLFAVAISGVMSSQTSSSDTIIGVFSATGVALGVVLLSANGGFSKYSNYLIGDILAVSPDELLLLLFVLLGAAAFWAAAFNPLMLASLNPDLAASKGISVKRYQNLFMIVVAFIVTVSIKWVGILIINALLVLPAAAARNVSGGMRSYHGLSILFSLFSGVSGSVSYTHLSVF